VFSGAVCGFSVIINVICVLTVLHYDTGWVGPLSNLILISLVGPPELSRRAQYATIRSVGVSLFQKDHVLKCLKSVYAEDVCRRHTTAKNAVSSPTVVYIL